MVRASPFCILVGLIAGAWPATLASQESVRPGDRVEGELTEADTLDVRGQVGRLIPLHAEPGAKLAVTLESTDFDAYVGLVVLVDGGFLAVAENDDSDELDAAGDARVRGLIQEGRAYAVWVGSFEGASTGGFVLRIDEARPGTEFPVAVHPDDYVSGTLGPDDPVDADGHPYEVFEVESPAPARLLAVADGDARPSLRLLDPGGYSAVVSFDDGGDRAFMEWPVERPGVYRITVTAANPGGGSFRLRAWIPPITTAELAGLAVGDSVIRHDRLGFELPRPRGPYAFVRGSATPWGEDGFGDYRMWTLEDMDAARRLIVLWYSTASEIERETFDAMVQTMAQSLAAGQGGGTTIRGKSAPGDALDYRATIGALTKGGASASFRCVGQPRPGKRSGFLCAVLSGVAVERDAERVFSGMVIR